MAGGSKVYSFEEVRKHDERDDCWLIISGKVYDVTRFMEEHPGGDEVLLACTGKDATADFQDIGHSDSAKELLPEYCIGEVDAATIPAKASYGSAPAGDGEAKAALTRGEGQGVWLTLMQVVVPLLLLAMAYALQNFAKAKTE